VFVGSLEYFILIVVSAPLHRRAVTFAALIRESTSRLKSAASENGVQANLVRFLTNKKARQFFA